MKFVQKVRLYREFSCLFNYSRSHSQIKSWLDLIIWVKFQLPFELLIRNSKWSYQCSINYVLMGSIINNFFTFELLILKRESFPLFVPKRYCALTRMFLGVLSCVLRPSSNTQNRSKNVMEPSWKWSGMVKVRAGTE